MKLGAGNSGLVAFVSHSHKDRVIAEQAKEVLNEAGIEAFVAHADIEVSEEWQRRICEELRRCHLFVPLLSKRFLKSKWTLQELGFIASRSNVKIVPLSIDGTIPFGFMSHIQSRPIGDDGITWKLLVEPLTMHFPREVFPYLIRRAGDAHSFRDAEFKMRSLLPSFGRLTNNEAQDLAEAAIDNAQVWSADQCRKEYLPEFIRVHGGDLQDETLRALEFQIMKNKWYEGSQ